MNLCVLFCSLGNIDVDNLAILRPGSWRDLILLYANGILHSFFLSGKAREMTGEAPPGGGATAARN